jgi:hypothetical protein
MDKFTIDYLNEEYQIHKIDLVGSDIYLEDFAIRFAPFVHLVNYWSQILALTVSKSSNPHFRKKIIKNLYDENCKDLSHVDTFKLFITECHQYKLASFIKEINASLKLDDQIKQNINLITNIDINSGIYESNPIISMHKMSIYDFIESNDFDDCCQMLGAIEYIYHLISGEINAYFNSKTNIDPLNHYTNREKLDIKYANDLFECKISTKEINTQNLDFGIKWITNSIRSLVYI